MPPISVLPPAVAEQVGGSAPAARNPERLYSVSLSAGHGARAADRADGLPLRRSNSHRRMQVERLYSSSTASGPMPM